ncbi:MAG: bifunctional transaldolase/phosoglucose isomerase [Dehalococcoidia bacterium]
MSNPIQQAKVMGQSTWIDYIRRSMLTAGELGALVEKGVTGLTSNPTIFEKAVGESTDYDFALLELAKAGKNAAEIFETLAVEDIQGAADILRSVYDATAGADGYVSMELPPPLAHDTAATIREARRLFSLLRRPNVMVKVPATPEGIPAVRALISEGINVNVTLIFSLETYRQVMEAYISGLEDMTSEGKNPARSTSVASFFVSRVDSAVDRELRRRADAGEADLEGLAATAAIANARMAYALFQEQFGSIRFAALQAKGARVQRPLWASTSTKDPALPDTLYVDSLIGPDTVNTMPPQTLEAVLDHGNPTPSLQGTGNEAAEALGRLRDAGIDMEEVAGKLLAEGVDAFAKSYRALLGTIEQKCGQLLTSPPGGSNNLGELGGVVEEAIAKLEEHQIVGRVWQRDYTVWKPVPKEITDRLGWLSVTDHMREQLGGIASFVQEVRAEGFTSVVLLGMGGSSLAGEVYRQTFGTAEGYPSFHMLDSTVPGWVKRVTDAIDPARTLFIVSSKSGGTVEVLSFYRHFRSLVEAARGKAGADRNFIAITDEGSPLQALAEAEGFRRVFLNPTDVGGRFSALSLFGLIPGALIGMDLQAFLDSADQMRERCEAWGEGTDNPGAFLGAVLGSMKQTRLDKLTILTSPGLHMFGLWVEQLIAESLGKEGNGIIPNSDEPPVPSAAYGPDRVFVYIRLEDDDNVALDEHAAALAAAGKPVLHLDVEDRYGLGGELFRWEFAIAVAGAILGVHPFDQENVQEAKDITEDGLREYIRVGKLPTNEPTPSVAALLKTITPGDYLALQIYLPQSNEVDEAVRRVRAAAIQRFGIATTAGYGPRYLHGLGQLHKGGPPTGVYIQVTGGNGADLPIPGTGYSFRVLADAQAVGDLLALTRRERRIARVDAEDPVEAMNALAETISQA